MGSLVNLSLVMSLEFTQNIFFLMYHKNENAKMVQKFSAIKINQHARENFIVTFKNN